MGSTLEDLLEEGAELAERQVHHELLERLHGHQGVHRGPPAQQGPPVEPQGPL